VRIKKCVNKNVIPKKKLSSRNIHAYSISTRIQPINELSLLSRFGTTLASFRKKMALLHHSILAAGIPWNSKKAKEERSDGSNFHYGFRVLPPSLPGQSRYSIEA
jgi:hypothetical protein